MRLNKKEMEEFRKLIRDIALMPEVRQMDQYIQHGKISTYKHCLCVAYVSFWISKRFRIPVREKQLLRGALLHDFYLYDWHIKLEPRKLHGIYHPVIACKNAEKLFILSDIEKDIIRKHMWPLTLVPPKFRESYIICLADKICSAKETLHLTIYVPDIS